MGLLLLASQVFLFFAYPVELGGLQDCESADVDGLLFMQAAFELLLCVYVVQPLYGEFPSAVLSEALVERVRVSSDIGV